MSEPRIVHLHGLESAVDPESFEPVGAKAAWLRTHYRSVVTPALRTEEARRVRAEIARGEVPPDAYERAFRTPVAAARAALAEGADVLVGSSFGGATALICVHEHGWRGPTVLLAAASGWTPYAMIPPDLPCVLVHGRRDGVIPIAHSRRLAASSPRAVLWEGDWDHRLHGILQDGTLRRAIEQVQDL